MWKLTAVWTRGHIWRCGPGVTSVKHNREQRARYSRLRPPVNVRAWQNAPARSRRIERGRVCEGAVSAEKAEDERAQEASDRTEDAAGTYQLPAGRLELGDAL